MSDTDKKILKSLNVRFSKFFKEVGLTQEDFAKRIGVARSQISSWKNGVHAPSGSAIKMMELEFNLNKAWFLYGHGDMFLSNKENSQDILTDREKQILSLLREAPEMETIILGFLKGSASLKELVAVAEKLPDEKREMAVRLVEALR